MSILTKMIGDKRRWREYKARVRRLPDNYRTAVEAIEHYVMYFGPTDGDSVMSMFEDLADRFEKAAADGTPIDGIVGEDPVAYADAFLQNYQSGGWVTRQRAKLTKKIALAAHAG
ncbi:DUF1048 domain-containing protein [Diaminobutyricibacter sp. McL0608]|uniref:DUF1048 domain-containing protein n=1 Tax=Leifsonia sp. McL0608 TaxID=3143537 RepID=UPI0031F2D73A